MPSDSAAATVSAPLCSSARFSRVPRIVLNVTAEVSLTELDILVCEEHELMPRFVDARRMHAVNPIPASTREHEVPLELQEEVVRFLLGLNTVILQEPLDHEWRLVLERSRGFVGARPKLDHFIPSLASESSAPSHRSVALPCQATRMPSRSRAGFAGFSGL